MRSGSFARSRRVTNPYTIGAPFVPWTGADFLQQTNFTGFAELDITLSDPAAGDPFFSPWSYASIAPANGDLIRISGTIWMTATQAGTPTNFQLKLTDGTAEVVLINETLDEGAESFFLFWCDIPVAAAGAWGVGTKGRLASDGSLDTIKITDADQLETQPPGTLSLTATSNQTASEWRLYNVTLTRVRAGL